MRCENKLRQVGENWEVVTLPGNANFHTVGIIKVFFFVLRRNVTIHHITSGYRSSRVMKKITLTRRHLLCVNLQSCVHRCV